MAAERTLTLRNVMDARMGTARTVSILGLIIAAASFLSTAMGYLGLPQQIAARINALNLTPLQLVALLLLICILLEGMSLIVMTLPIGLPLITAAGYIQALTGEKLGAVVKAAFPFFVLMVFFTFVLAVFPEIVMFLPSLL